MNELEPLLKFIGLVVGTVTGVWGLARLVVAPLKKRYTAWRLKHPAFREKVLDALNVISDRMDQLDDFQAAMLRERLESAYTVYAIDMQWCPTGEKHMLVELYDLYTSRGWNHINKRYREIIMALPEHPPND